MYETLARYIRTLEYIPLSPLGVSTETLRWRLEEDGFPISLRSVQRDLVKLAGWFPVAERPMRKGARARHWSWVGRTPLGLRSLGPLTAVVPQDRLALPSSGRSSRDVGPRASKAGSAALGALLADAGTWVVTVDGKTVAWAPHNGALRSLPA